MKIREKTNIKLFLGDETENYYILSNCSIFDYGNPNPYIEPDGYTYILPKRKSFFSLKGRIKNFWFMLRKLIGRISWFMFRKPTGYG